MDRRVVLVRAHLQASAVEVRLAEEALVHQEHAHSPACPLLVKAMTAVHPVLTAATVHPRVVAGLVAEVDQQAVVLSLVELEAMVFQ